MRKYTIRIEAMRRAVLTIILLLGVTCTGACASGSANQEGSLDIASMLLALIIVLVAAKLGGEIFVRLKQPAVLGELVMGMVVGNLYLAGIHGFEFIRHNEAVAILSEIGVILLLFQVGLESDMGKMMKVGSSALLVASLGIIAPFFLGWGVAAFFLPNESVYVHLFIGATLCATSVGITARVFLDLGRIQTSEARIVLGAAVIDDVQGLVILAVVSGIISAANSGIGSLSTWAIMLIVLKATVFLCGALIIGKWMTPKVFHFASRFKASDLLLTTGLGLCFVFGYLAKVIDLAPIVGAFAAGLILEEVHWKSFTERGEHSILELVKPLTGFLVPVFFVRMGAEVELSAFADPAVLGFAGTLTIAAIFGKQICSLGVLQKGVDRLSVGIGMVPRGEVGLIFAAIGSKLMLNGQPVVQPATFSAVVIMVVITTMITPPVLKWSLGRGSHK